MKKLILILIIGFSGAFLLSSCGQKQARQKWEYKIVYFDREENKTMQETLKTLGQEGWQYAGPLTNYDINVQLITAPTPL